MSDTSCLEKWPDLRRLDKKTSISLAIVIRSKDDDSLNVIFVTKDDEVYGYGVNQCGCLATGNDLPISKPVKIEALCGQKITSIECEGKSCVPSLFALTSFGSVFAWGNNAKGKLGLGDARDVIKTPTEIAGNLVQKMVVQVATSETHTLALTSIGEVFAFGSNSIGQLGIWDFERKNKYLPTRVQGLAYRFITAVSCGYEISAFIDDTGAVYFSGAHNGDDYNGPTRMFALAGIPVAKIACGLSHFLALSRDGQVYAWGEDSYGNLGPRQSRSDAQCAQLLATNMGRVTDITASGCHLHPNAAINEDGQVFIWGYCSPNMAMLRRPSKINFSTLDEVYATFATPAATVRPLRPKIPKAESLTTCSVQFFDDPDTSDFTFTVEEKKIHAHKLILMMRSDKFREIFKRSESKEVVTEHSYAVFHAFLKYIYTDEIKMNQETVIDVLALAYAFEMTDLKERCVHFMKNNLTFDNVGLYYDKAILHGCKDLMALAYRFCWHHYNSEKHQGIFDNVSAAVKRDFVRRHDKGRKSAHSEEEVEQFFGALFNPRN
ncbi:RCC1 and BTB domain-containing protein 1-like [Cloeon dipterum]|uniref:RCC1 and BTB domain-containing protein 1-like n=1 Tax=Cloeon dipterum TaxID=197152 RepID=UPI00322033E4